MVIFKRVIIEVAPKSLGKYVIVSKQKISVELIKTKKSLNLKEKEYKAKEKELKKNFEESVRKEVRRQVAIELEKIENIKRNEQSQDLLYEIKKLRKENEQLKNEISKNKQEINSKNFKIAKLESENSSLRNEISKQTLDKEKELNRKSLEENSKKEEKKKEELKLKEIKDNKKNEQSHNILSQDYNKSITKTNVMDNFHIVSNNKILFSQDCSRNLNSMNKIKDLYGILNYLNTANNENKDIYIKIVSKYNEMINKFINNIDFDKYDEDEISEELSEGFFKILKKYFIDKLMVGIYRGMKSGDSFYLGFLKNINEYLKSCNVYTRLLKINVKKTREDDNDIDILPKPTDDESKNNIIEEIEMLPYYLDFINEYGEKESIVIYGRAIVLSSKLN